MGYLVGVFLFALFARLVNVAAYLSGVQEPLVGILANFVITFVELAAIAWVIFPLLRIRNYFYDYENKTIPEIPKNVTSTFREIQSVLNAIHGIEYKNQELEELRIKREAEQNQFFANVSHELRTPLTTLQGCLDLFADGDIGSITHEQMHYVQTMQQALNRLTAMVNNTIDLSKIEVGKMQVEKVAFPFIDELDFVRAQFEPQFMKKHIEFSSDMDEDLPEILADPDKVKQILMNLVSNAVKYTPDGGKISLEAHGAPDNPCLILISVSDTGIGIPAENLEEGKLFSKFYQVRTKDARIGSGLGLAIVKQLVILMNGAVSVESEVGKGTTFTVTLPASRENHDC